MKNKLYLFFLLHSKNSNQIDYNNFGKKLLDVIKWGGKLDLLYYTNILIKYFIKCDMGPVDLKSKIITISVIVEAHYAKMLSISLNDQIDKTQNKTMQACMFFETDYCVIISTISQ